MTTNAELMALRTLAENLPKIAREIQRIADYLERNEKA